MNVEEKALLTSVLRDVSRSFYLTLRVLPSSVRRPIGIAYLLARATDTIADTEIVKLPIRLDALQRLRARIEGVSNARLDFGGFAQQQGTPGERILLQRIDDVLRVFQSLTVSDQLHVKSVLRTIISGQELDLERFSQASAKNIIPLQSDADLTDYTFRVAGCVGEFWTKLCLAHFPLNSILNRPQLIDNGIRFGKGLQLVNILRDIPADLKNGRCYIPEAALGSAHLTPTDLTAPGNIEKFRPVYDRYLNYAEQHLEAGWIYTNTLPFNWCRIRLACAWPILIGLRTIAHLRRENPLDPSRRVKASRREVKSLILRSIISYPFPRAWRAQYTRALIHLR
ncbi:MAG TPA: phytoene/squalene synthase family protein [Verrucomicrobiae bacterium]|nr:phytoene/squalene synthase family protein [Verrucomicrobiae bacterium]